MAARASVASGLEIELQSQLQLTRAIHRRGDFAEIAVSNDHVGPLKLWMVKDVESFGTKLKADTLVAFGQAEIFEERDVHVFSAGLAHAGDGARCVAEGKGSDGSGVLQYADIVANGVVEGGI